MLRALIERFRHIVEDAGLRVEGGRGQAAGVLGGEGNGPVIEVCRHAGFMGIGQGRKGLDAQGFQMIEPLAGPSPDR